MGRPVKVRCEMRGNCVVRLSGGDRRDGDGISKREGKWTIWQSREEHYRDNMIRFRTVICLLSVVLAVDSEDKFEQCALVNELVEKGKVRCA